MQWRSTKEIRDLFLDFWVSKGSRHYKSFSLVPDDPTLLFTIAGMVPFKQYYLGLKQPEHARAVTSQKCVRTNDIENVGHTARHHTFFEMLGNFAWGDYFKKEAITWAWEFLTDRIGMEPERLYATIYKDDEESFDAWHNIVGLPENRIYRFGEDENYWFMGDTGPCGPCSEIMYDQGPEYSCGKPTCDVGCDCDRYLEIWNLVFTQFDRQKDGTLLPLPKKNIDTGMGLERLASVVQNVRTDFEIDIFRPVIDKVCSMAGIGYGDTEKGDLAARVVADHLRSVAFMIADGILPANEGQGYVLRRLIRRAERYGRLIGLEDPFLVEILPVVIAQMGDPYAELLDNRLTIEQIISVEENRFSRTLEQGTELLESEIGRLNENEGTVLAGNVAFELYDTYGFPLELTKEICGESGLDVDEKVFAELMLEQKERARAASKQIHSVMKGDIYTELLNRFGPTSFTGYTDDTSVSRVETVVKEGSEAEQLAAGEEGEIFLDATPFYAERGGQVGDRGMLIYSGGEAEVTDTVHVAMDLVCHKVKVLKGSLSTGMQVRAVPDMKRRNAVSRNHTATHLLHEALSRVVGGHVRQSGSLVSDEFLRFDFTHFEPMSSGQIEQVEDIVNAKILDDMKIVTDEMDIESAKATGAKALFEEKYGNRVRVVKVPGFSSELCGGIHVKSTGQIGLFKIIREEGIGSGLRRITAVTGFESLKMFRDSAVLMQSVAQSLSADPAALLDKLDKIKQETKDLKRELQQLKKESLASSLDDHVNSMDLDNGMVLLRGTFEDVSGDMMRDLGDRLKSGRKGCVIVLASSNGAKGVSLLSMADAAAVESGVDAGRLIREISVAVKGAGGGRPGMAQAGGKDPSGIAEAMDLAVAVAKKQLKLL